MKKQEWIEERMRFLGWKEALSPDGIFLYNAIYDSPLLNHLCYKDESLRDIVWDLSAKRRDLVDLVEKLDARLLELINNPSE